MATKIIILFAKLKVRLQSPGGRCTHRTMVVANPFDERPGLPAFHSRRGNCDPIDTATFHLGITANLFKTLAPKELARARDMVDAGESEVVRCCALDEWSSRYSESRISSQLGEQKVEVLVVESDIGIEVRHKIELFASQPIVPSIEALDLGGKMSVSSLGHSYQFYPWMGSPIF